MSDRFPIPDYWNVPQRSNEHQIDLIHDLLTSKSASKLRQLYRRHFKKIPLVRAIAYFGFQCIRTLIKLTEFCIGPLANSGKHYPVFKFKEYVSKNGLKVIPLIGGCTVQVSLPKVYPSKEASLVTPKLPTFQVSSIDVVELQAATVVGGSNIVFSGGVAICHDLYDFKADDTSEELHNLFRIDPEKNTIKINKEPEYVESLTTAAIFLDSCAQNYAHWISEVLPRIAAFCKEDRFKDVPLIVDQGLHINLMESLSPIVGRNRKILTIPRHQFIEFDSLLLVSAAGYVPFGVRSTRFGEPSQGVFNPLALKQMAEVVIEKMKDLPQRQWPDKIFLTRPTKARNLINGLSLEFALADRGYTQIDPGELTFLEQVQLFSRAKKIVSTTGAALVNAIFSPPGSEITVIMSKHKEMIYRYWLNMLSPLGLDITYILGEAHSKKYLGIHADFVISNQCILDYFADMDNI